TARMQRTAAEPSPAQSPVRPAAMAAASHPRTAAKPPAPAPLTVAERHPQWNSRPARPAPPASTRPAYPARRDRRSSLQARTPAWRAVLPAGEIVHRSGPPRGPAFRERFQTRHARGDRNMEFARVGDELLAWKNHWHIFNANVVTAYVSYESGRIIRPK